MNPRLLICAILMLHTLTSWSQPQFTATPFLPHTGDSYTVGRCMAPNEGPSGANQSWDFSDVNVIASATYVVSDALDILCHAEYPEATQAIGEGGGFDMISHTDNEVLSYGITQTPGMAGFYYSNPRKIMSFPMSMNDTWTDTFNGTDPNGTMRSGNTSVVYDGYGTITTPFGVYADVLRLHQSINYADVTSDGNCTASLDYYFWYAADYRYPIAAIWSGTGECGLATGCEFLSGIETAVKEESKGLQWTVYPNPFLNKLIVESSQCQNNNTMVITDLLGREIHRQSCGSGNLMVISAPSLANGIYLLRVIEKGEVLLQRKIVRSGE